MTAIWSVVDRLAQLRRWWAAVAGGGLVGFITGLAIGAPTPSPAIVAVSILLGLVGGFAVVLAAQELRPRVVTVADVRLVTGLPVVAQLPAGALDSDGYDDRPTSHRMRTALREAIMNTCSLVGGALPHHLVVARTDSVSESAGIDGGLARALVESGWAAALIHTDLESRLVARPSTIVESPLGETVLTDSGGYQRIPVPDRVASSLPRDRLAAVGDLLDSLVERHDVTVAQAASNSLPVPLRGIAPVADVVLLVVRSNRTSVEDLLALHSELLSVGVEPLGVILTGVATRHRVLLRGTWLPDDFRASSPPSAGGRSELQRVSRLSIADLEAAAGDVPRLGGRFRTDSRQADR